MNCLSGSMLFVNSTTCTFISDTLSANTVKLQWLEHLWDHENLFETGVVQATESLL